MVAIGLVAVVALGCMVAIHQVTRPFPKLTSNEDVFGFSEIADSGTRPMSPELKRFSARDGSKLAYRFYDSDSNTVLIFIHGSSYHGGAYHRLAEFISGSGVAKVYLPNLRGHYMSGVSRGDVDYVGQLEDDLADLIGHARSQGHGGPVVMGGHSSGGGLAIRFAGGPHRELASAFLLLSPLLPQAPTVRGGNAGGWASVHRPRLLGLVGLNALGITGLNGLQVIRFNKPEAFWDGTETLAYSYRLNQSYHPRYEYRSDIAAMGDRVLVLVGEADEANDASAYAGVFAESGSRGEIVVLPGLNHFAVFSDDKALGVARDWLEGTAD